jgi:hypothetical protein
MLRTLSWILAVFLALIAAFVYRREYEALAAVIWLISLVLVLPMWADFSRAKAKPAPER